MRVADSSYLVEGLLKRKELFDGEPLLTLDFAVYEVANSIWKHEFLLKDIENGAEYLSILQGFIETGTIQLLHASRETLVEAYSIAAVNKRSIYDTAFVALALELGLELWTFDKRQADVVRKAKQNKK